MRFVQCAHCVVAAPCLYAFVCVRLLRLLLRCFPVWLPCKTRSLVKNLLGTLFKFTSSFVVHLLLFRYGGSAISLHLLLLLPTRWEVSASGRVCCNCLGSVCLLGRAALSDGGGCSSGLLFRLLANDVEDAVFECLFVLGQPVLLPSVVKDATVEVVPSNARLKETVASPVVGLLFKFECATVLHELSKFRWVTPAELFKRSLDLLLLNSVVLFVLAATWQTLPGEGSLDEVEQDVTDRLQIIASTLFNALVSSN